MQIHDTKLTNQELHVLLRAIATHNVHPDTASLDKTTGDWLAQRFRVLLAGVPAL